MRLLVALVVNVGKAEEQSFVRVSSTGSFWHACRQWVPVNHPLFTLPFAQRRRRKVQSVEDCIVACQKQARCFFPSPPAPLPEGEG
jgi:hypothetical protein